MVFVVTALALLMLAVPFALDVRTRIRNDERSELARRLRSPQPTSGPTPQPTSGPSPPSAAIRSNLPRVQERRISVCTPQPGRGSSGRAR